MTPKKQHVIAPRKSDAKKNILNAEAQSKAKTHRHIAKKKSNEFGDPDSF